MQRFKKSIKAADGKAPGNEALADTEAISKSEYLDIIKRGP